MPTVEKICIALTPELAALVREAVDGGEYASSSEVIRDALRDWKHKRALQEEQKAEIRRLWYEGLESGPGRFHSIGDIKAEAKARFLAKRAKE